MRATFRLGGVPFGFGENVLSGILRHLRFAFLGVEFKSETFDLRRLAQLPRVFRDELVNLP